MHGLTHDRQLFSSRQAFEERLPALADSPVNSARLVPLSGNAPGVRLASELPVDYDCTISNSDP